MRAHLSVEQLEDRCTPIVHSFSASIVGQAQTSSAAGTAATAMVLRELDSTPAPIAASAGHAAGEPFTLSPPHAPGRDVLASHLP
jgi:hypothetical protein